jgi:hypothetical protein
VFDFPRAIASDLHIHIPVTSVAPTDEDLEWSYVRPDLIWIGDREGKLLLANAIDKLLVVLKQSFARLLALDGAERQEVYDRGVDVLTIAKTII